MRTSPLKIIGFLTLCATFGVQAAVFTTDFNSGLPANTALFNCSDPATPGPGPIVDTTGGVGDSGVLKITQAINGRQGSFVINDFNNLEPVTNFVARYQAYVGGGNPGLPPADGYSFSFGTLPDGCWSEDGAPGASLTVSFDTWDNGPPTEAPACDIVVNGALVARTAFQASTRPSTATNYSAVEITLCGGRVTVKVGNQVLHDRVATAYTPVAGRWGFGARTGGANDNHWIDDLTIDTSDPGAVAITSQPASQTVNEGQAATFSIAVNGSCYTSLQWFSNGVAIAGANSLSYTTPPATTDMNGALYRAEVTDAAGTVVSDNATLTVIPAPIVVGASSRLNPNGVFIFYNKNVSESTGLNTANYEILGGGITITGAVFNTVVATNGERSVVLLQTTPAFVGGQTYTVRITGVQDDGGNTIIPNPTEVSFTHGVGSVCYDFNSGLPAGTTIYGNARIDPSGGVKNSGVLRATDAALSQSGAFRTAELVPGHAVTRLQASFMMRVDTPQSGNPADGFSFNLAANLPAGTYGIAEEGEGNGLSVSFDNWDSAGDNAPSIDIKWAGAIVPGGHRPMAKHNHPAYIPMSLEVTADGLVTLKLDGTNVFTDLQTPFQPITGARAGLGGRTGGAFEGHAFDDLCLHIFNGGPVNFTQPLADQTVTEFRSYKFRLNVDGSPPYIIQWYSNDVAIAGANGEVLSGVATLDANGAVFHAVVNNEFSTATSASATLTVLDDMEGPVLLSIKANRQLNTVTLVFNEALDPDTATDNFNTSIDGLNIISRYVTNGNTTLVLVTDPQTPSTTYNVNFTLVDVTLDNQTMATVPVSAWVMTRGFVQTEIYKEIYGTAVSALTGAGKYPNSPDATVYSHIADWRQPQTGNPTRTQDEPWNNYGVRMSGFFIPRVDGVHRFYFTHDDEAQLRMSADANPANIVLTHTATGVRNLPYTDILGQNVDSASLVAGVPYYFETLMKEGGGGDYLSVGVREPGNTIGTNGITAIQNVLLAALADPTAAPALTITQQPADATVTSGQSATFSVGASYGGNNVPFYVWKIDGVAVPGANGPTFVTPPATTSGTVTVDVNLPGVTVTSSAAALTVVNDTAGPVITGSVVLSGNSVSMGFDEAITIDSPGSLTDPANYLVNDTPGLVTAVTVMTPSSVQLTVSGTLSGTTTVRAGTAIEDAAGNPVAEGDMIGYSAAFTSVPVKTYTDISGSAGATAGPPLPAGTVFTVNNRDFIVTAGGADVWSGGDQFTYIYEQRTGDFDVRVRVDRLDLSTPNGNLWSKAGINVRETLNGSAGFASRMAWVYPTPTNGAAQFEAAIRNQPGRDVTDINGGSYGRWGRGTGSPWVRIKRVGKSFTYYNSYDGQNWNPIGLPRVADANPENGIGGLGLGIADAIEFADTLYVGLGVVSHNQNAPSTANLGDFSDWAYPSASVSVVENPKDTMGHVGGVAKFSVAGLVSGAPQLELLVQWQKNGVDIPGAVSSYVDNYSYTTPPLTLDDDGAQFRARLVVSGAAPVYSDSATVSMLGSGDATPIQLLMARRNPLDANQVILTFNKLLRPSSVTSVGNYTIDQGVTVLSAERRGTRKVLLTTSGMAPLSNCVEYAISVSGVQDGDGVAMTPTDTVIPEAPAGRAYFLTGNAVGANRSDRIMIDRIDALGYEVDALSVTAASRRGAAGAAGYSLIFLSSQGGTTMGSTLRGLAVPTIVARRDLADDYDMVPGIGQGTVGAQTSLNIVGAGHPLAAGFPNGNRLVVDLTQAANRTINWFSNPPASGIIVAREVPAPSRIAILAFETGAPLLNGRFAASRRVASYLEDNVAQFFNNDARTLFDAMINWMAMPAILQQPTPTNNVAYGDDVVLCVVAGTPSNPTYQWYRNGVAVSGATDARLALNDVQDSNAGNYTVVIGNASGGFITSAVARVIIPLPDLDIVKSGNTATLSWTGVGTLQEATTIEGPWRNAADQSNPQTINLPSYGCYLNGAQEPSGGGTGTGSGSVQVIGDTTLEVHITFEGLSGTTTGAHIHGPAPRGMDAGVLYPLNVPAGVQSGTISQTVTLQGDARTRQQQLQQLQDGLWYINIHTSTFGGGEIRGQLDRTQFFRVVRP
jgi:hypothetical protein